MAITVEFLRNITAEARPIIERQMNDAKIIAGLRNVVASNGGDWGALKALIKAHVEDENDEAGEGKRVQKILDKADSSTAYADMLGLANMNENNFSARSYAEQKGRGELADNQESVQSHDAAVDGAPAESVSDEISATNSHQPASIQSPDRAGEECVEESRLPAPAVHSHSQAPSQPADMADSAHPPALSAAHSDRYDPGAIPAFLDRRQPKAREWEDA